MHHRLLFNQNQYQYQNLKISDSKKKGNQIKVDSSFNNTKMQKRKSNLDILRVARGYAS